MHILGLNFKLSISLFFVGILFLYLPTYASIYSLPEQRIEYHIVYQRSTQLTSKDRLFDTSLMPQENTNPFININIPATQTRTNIIKNNFFSVTLLKSNTDSIERDANDLLDGNISDIFSFPNNHPIKLHLNQQ